MHNGRVPRTLFESCVESVAAAAASARAGADRVEFCANLDAGGTTPDPRDLERCVATVAVPVFAMARVRPGPFVYTASELHATLDDIRTLKAAGADGVVLGALTPAGAVDVDATARLIEAARPLPVTFHRAFDETRDLDAALDALLALGVDRVLTAGGAATALGGGATLRRLVTRADGRLIVVAGGGIRAHTVAAVVGASGAAEVHARLLTVRGDDGSEADAWHTAVEGMMAALRAFDASVQAGTSMRPARP